MDFVFARRRRLHFEHLEPKNAPGAFLWTAGLFGASIPFDSADCTVTATPDTNDSPEASRFASTVQARQMSSPGDPATAQAGTAASDAALTLLNERQPATASLNSSKPVSALPRPASALAMNLFAAAPSALGLPAAAGALLNVVPYAPHRPAGGGGGGGGARAAESGSAGNGHVSAAGSFAGAASGSSINAAVPATPALPSSSGAASPPLTTTAAADALGLADVNHTSCTNKSAANVPAAAPLKLVDASGKPIPLTIDANTLVIGVASWCPHCAELEMILRDPTAQANLSGLKIFFAFGDEGGAGPGGIRNADVLANLPGEAVFLTADSLKPERFPNALDAATGQFNADPYDAITAWYTQHVGGTGHQVSNSPGDLRSDTSAGSGDPRTTGLAPGSGLDDPPGSGTEVTITGDFNGDFHVDAADYVVWRKTEGQTGANLPADANNDQVVNNLDYDIWRAHFGDELTAPGAFTIDGPVGTQTQPHVTVSWTASDRATSYHLVISQNFDLSAPFIDQSLTTNSFATDLADGDYYVGVTATNAAGNTTASNQPSFFNVLLQQDQVLFVSDVAFLIDPMQHYPPLGNSFGGPTGADFHCTNLAANAGLIQNWDFQTLYFRALVTTVTSDIPTRAGLGNNKYYNTAGQVIANNFTDLMNGNFSAPILTNAGTTLTGIQAVWTGALSNGNPSVNNCNIWSSTTGIANAGNVNGTGTNWINQGTVSCSSQFRLYCVGNKPTS